MEIYYSPRYIQFMIIIGIVWILCGILGFVARTPTWFLFILGLFIIFAAVAAREKSYLTIEPNSINLHAFIGPLTRRYAYNSPSEVHIENNKLYIERDGKRKNIPVAKWIIRDEDWAALQEKFR
jgi:hypothetical protein